MNNFHNVLTWGEEEGHLIGIQRKFMKYFPSDGTVLDLGCGRGVFLALLKQEGFDPVGVEMDKIMYSASKDRGFKVHHDDAVNFLHSSKEKFDGIFASHIIEHVDIQEGTKLIALIKSHLKPGGVAIVITPRPGSLWATENFWLDTTHVRPYPYELMKQLFAPMEVLAGGIEPDSNPIKDVSGLKSFIFKLRRLIIGNALFDFAYGGGVSYIVVKNS